VDRSWEYINRSHRNVEIGTTAVEFPEKKYINWIFVAVFADLKTTYIKYKCKLE
jgi:hypothetical protein